MERSTTTPELRVFDASVAINLLAIETSAAREILSARGGRYAITSVVLDREALHDPRSEGTRAAPRLEALMAKGLVARVALTNEATARYVDLAATARLGDGEAATLAHCQDANAVAMLDDADGIAQAVTLAVPVEWTTDLLLHERVVSALGARGVAEVLFDALRFGRMRVPERHWSEVIRRVGKERALECRSLPRRALGRRG